MTYTPNPDRYKSMEYDYCGNSGLQLPILSLGLWHNFGGVDVFENSKKIILKAFDKGITHFDLANNYGPPAGSAEDTFGKILHSDLQTYRDEIIISTKAGYGMWEGPYGDGGSKKYLIASLHQSLRRMNIDYVDIFYHHRFDPNTPLEETADALELLYKQGKALYIGISNYSALQTNAMLHILEQRNVPCLIHQFKYSLFEREPELGLLQAIDAHKMGSIAFSPLAQGLLTDRYINEIPAKSRITRENSFLRMQELEEKLPKIKALHQLALERNQSLAAMSIAWLWEQGVSSVLIGASSVEQLETNLEAIASPRFTEEDLERIDSILTNAE